MVSIMVSDGLEEGVDGIGNFIDCNSRLDCQQSFHL